MSARLRVPDAAERDDLAMFCARAVRLDQGALVRLRGDGERVEAWASTPFDTLVTYAVTGTVAPVDLTVAGSDLLAALSIVGGPAVDPGTRCDERWRGPVPGPVAWTELDEVPGPQVDAHVERAIAAAQASDPPLDEVAFTAQGHDAAGAPDAARVPVRCLVTLAGMGLVDGGGPLRVSTGGPWIRLGTPGGDVVRRRWTLDLRPV